MFQPQNDISIPVHTASSILQTLYSLPLIFYYVFFLLAVHKELSSLKIFYIYCFGPYYSAQVWTSCLPRWNLCPHVEVSLRLPGKSFVPFLF